MAWVSQQRHTRMIQKKKCWGWCLETGPVCVVVESQQRYKRCWRYTAKARPKSHTVLQPCAGAVGLRVLCAQLLYDWDKSVHTGHPHTVENGHWMDGFWTPLISSCPLCSAGTGQSWGTLAQVISGSHSSLRYSTSLWLPPKCQTPVQQYRTKN